MAPRKIDRLYLVEERSWTVLDADSRRPLPHLAKMTGPHDSRKGYVFAFNYACEQGHHPVRAFLDADKAEAFCKHEEDDAWQGINPFRYGHRKDWTSLDAGRLRDMMLDIGFEPPLGKFDVAKWRKWYDAASANATEWQKQEVRRALDRLHFFRVTELTE